jgi:hypothetical protein
VVVQERAVLSRDGDQGTEVDGLALIDRLHRGGNKDKAPAQDRVHGDQFVEEVQALGGSGEVGSRGGLFLLGSCQVWRCPDSWGHVNPRRIQQPQPLDTP